MKILVMEILFPSFIFLILLNSSCHLNEKKVDTYDNLKKRFERDRNRKDDSSCRCWWIWNGSKQWWTQPIFFQFVGQNCFETLRYFKKSDNTKNAAILEKAMDLINPKKLRETELVESLLKKIVAELEDSTINSKL